MENEFEHSIEDTLGYIKKNHIFQSYHQRKRTLKKVRDYLKNMEAIGKSWTKEQILEKFLQDRCSTVQPVRTNQGQSNQTPTPGGSPSNPASPNKLIPVQFFVKGDSDTIISGEPEILAEESPSPQKKKRSTISFYKGGELGLNLPEPVVPDSPETNDYTTSQAQKAGPAVGTSTQHIRPAPTLSSVKRRLFKHDKYIPLQDIKSCPTWLQGFRKAIEKEEKPTSAAERIEKLQKQKNKLECQYRNVVCQNAVLMMSAASTVNKTVQDHVSPYSFCQGRASLDHIRQTVSVPHPDLGTISVPNVDCVVRGKLPVQADKTVLIGQSEHGQVVLKRHSSVFQAVSEYHALKEITHIQGVPQVLGIHYKYNEAFVVTKLIPTECPWVTLKDLTNEEAFAGTNVRQWKELLLGIWKTIDALHAIGYIHNKITMSNIVVSVNDSGDLVPYLTGFSLLCHIQDALRLQGRHTKEFAQLISHMHQDIYRGTASPTFANDVYCFGCILSDLCMIAQRLEIVDNFWDKLRHLAKHCNKSELRKIPSGYQLRDIVLEIFAL